jgi:hypothetical protein
MLPESSLPFHKSHQPEYISIQTAYIHFLYPQFCIFYGGVSYSVWDSCNRINTSLFTIRPIWYIISFILLCRPAPNIPHPVMQRETSAP